jgi:glycosyltransferase involved in cell wall biosynthesis
LVKHDIIHVHDTLPLLFWWLPLRLLYPLKRVSVTFHGFERDPIPHHFVLLRRLANRVASRTLCIGRFIQTQYGIKCGKISVGAVTPSKSSNPSPEDSALFVGRLEEDTGILDYVETIHILKEKYNIDIPLRILGEGRLADEIKQRARESKVTIELLGVVDNPEYYIERARFCFAAGYLSILEALALSVPVIGLAKTSLKHEYLLSMKEAGAPISIQQSSSLIADEVVRLLSDNELYSRIQSTGRAFALKMNWEKLEIIYLKMWSN